MFSNKLKRFIFGLTLLIPGLNIISFILVLCGFYYSHLFFNVVKKKKFKSIRSIKKTKKEFVIL